MIHTTPSSPGPGPASLPHKHETWRSLLLQAPALGPQRCSNLFNKPHCIVLGTRRWYPFQWNAFIFIYSAIHKATFSWVTSHSLQNGKMLMGIRGTEQCPEAALYGGRPSGGFVNSAVCCPWKKSHLSARWISRENFTTVNERGRNLILIISFKFHFAWDVSTVHVSLATFS